ncbi:sensor histidine kinase [Rhizobium sp. BR 314]|uniref:sensor histidine kinase n=1 Tax=Rhizobium sp. BR 314 TaxID=3040013 RepID=UPI0039BF4F76
MIIIALLASIIIGLCIWSIAMMSPNIVMKNRIISSISQAITRDDKRRLILIATPELEELKKQNSRLWFVAATADGASTSYGSPPAIYAALTHFVHYFDAADIQNSLLTNEVAMIENIETSEGGLRIMFGGVSGKNWPLLALFFRLFPVYVSLIAIACLAVCLTVPRIVRHSLARVSAVAQEAAEIDLTHHRARLPIEGIPDEVAPLVVGFNEALERLENEVRKRQRFLIDAAHELRTPIAIMLTRIDGMNDGPERRRLLDDMARLAETAEQLLNFERHDQMIDSKETVDLVEIARTVVADLAPLAISAGYQISLEADVESLSYEGSPSALPRAITNLVRNAVDHGGNAGMITVSVSADRRIVVSDEGPGIPVEHQELVFEPFYRAAPKSTGAGLGLSVVRQIITNHHGKVSLESGPEGTRIVIQL